MRHSFFRTGIAGFILLATILSVSIFAGDKIELKKKFFSPVKYSFNGQDPKPIYTFSGMDCQPHFKKIIRRCPDAYKEIKTTYAYNGVSLAGSAIMLLGSVLMLSNTLQEAEDVNNGKLTSGTSDSSPLGLVIVGAVVSIVGGSIAGSHLKKGIQIFNKKQTQVSEEEKASGLKLHPGSDKSAKRMEQRLVIHRK